VPRQPSSRNAIQIVAASANVLTRVTPAISARNGSADPSANSSAANGV
jgi:hypothetical protein